MGGRDYGHRVCRTAAAPLRFGSPHVSYGDSIAVVDHGASARLAQNHHGFDSRPTHHHLAADGIWAHWPSHCQAQRSELIAIVCEHYRLKLRMNAHSGGGGVRFLLLFIS